MSYRSGCSERDLGWLLFLAGRGNDRRSRTVLVDERIVCAEDLAARESVVAPKCGRPGGEQRVDQILPVLVGSILERRWRQKTPRDGVGAQVERGARARQLVDASNELVARCGSHRAPVGCRKPSRLALVQRPLVVVSELARSHQRRVRVALAHHTRALPGAGAKAVVIDPALRLQLATQRDPGEMAAAEVRRVGRYLPAAVALPYLLLAQPLRPRLIQNKQRGINQRQNLPAGVLLKPRDGLRDADGPSGRNHSSVVLDRGYTGLVGSGRVRPCEVNPEVSHASR